MNIQEHALKVIPLGGLGEVGKNMMALEYEEEIVVIDAGMSFPDSEMHGVNVVVPDMEYLRMNQEKVKKLIITHGHEDHIGGVPYFLKEFPVDVYATRLTAELIRNKLKEHRIPERHLKIIDASSKVQGNKLHVRFFETSHSIPDSVGIVIETPLGNVVHTSDFKVDFTPVGGNGMDFQAITEVANEGVFLLLSDSTNATKPGFSVSEQAVADELRKKIYHWGGRVIATTFASSLYRIQSLIRIAEETNRKVVPVGRSMKNNIRIAATYGYLKVKDKTLITEKQIKNYNEEDLLVITTGSQGEDSSALRRMAADRNVHMELAPNDLIIFSSHAIPGNEAEVYGLVNDLTRKGVQVVMDDKIHTSGHGYQEEIKLLMKMVRPTHFVPVHGEYRMLKTHAAIAESLGVDPANIRLCENGDCLRFTDKGVTREAPVPSGSILVDDSGMGEVQRHVLRDRERMANHGAMIVRISKGNKGMHTKVQLKGVTTASSLKPFYRDVHGKVVEVTKKKYAGERERRKALYEGLSDVAYDHLKRRPLVILMD